MQFVKRVFPYLTLVVLQVILMAWVVPEGKVFGSETDWLCQHVVLAETIRDACVAQHTLLPNWIGLGGGANGYQFAYYGFLRPDVLLGCLLPNVSMTPIFMGYALIVGLASTSLCYIWLYRECGRRDVAWFGSVLFMTAGCLFHLHRQIMFVNAFPFLFLALLCICNGRRRLLPLWLFFICVSSFYFAPACFLAVGWYWWRKEGRRFFLKWLGACTLGAGMAAMLLLPVACVLLAQRSSDSGGVTLHELLTPNWDLNSLLVDAYGMGLTLLALYALLVGLTQRKTRADSVLLLAMGLFPLASYVLNGTLYARPKSLIPFMPLVILLVVSVLCDLLRQRKAPLWPFAILLAMVWLWHDARVGAWLLGEWLLLLCFVLLLRRRGRAFLALLLIAPIGIYGTTAAHETWVSQEQLHLSDEKRWLNIEMDARYHLDSLLQPLEAANRLPKHHWRSSMYASLTNQGYNTFYYDTLMTPIQANNRVAMLTANDPFLLHLFGSRYLETYKESLPVGYHVIAEEGDVVLAENPHVLPTCYVTTDIVAQDWFDALSPYAKLDALARYTVVDGVDAGTGNATGMQPCTPHFSLVGNLPEGVHFTRHATGWEVAANNDVMLTLQVGGVPDGHLLLGECKVDNQTRQAVVIEVNGVPNKLSNASAPYPNGNTTFHVKCSSAKQLHIRLSAGHYQLSAFRWYSYDMAHFAEKSLTPLQLSPSQRKDTIVSGWANVHDKAIFATTIPLTDGLTIRIDGKTVPLLRVNDTFAGAALVPGHHRIEVCFTPPGKKLSMAFSGCAALVYLLYIGLGQRFWRK
ncbi:MAG: YfhO family protein [Peptococcaceae bacterium]|nr:YfhO family protein [Peptococcaceae bacterium]